jgi:hypothetical protein
MLDVLSDVEMKTMLPPCGMCGTAAGVMRNVDL